METEGFSIGGREEGDRLPVEVSARQSDELERRVVGDLDRVARRIVRFAVRRLAPWTQLGFA